MFNQVPELPDFKPLVLSGSVRGSFLTPTFNLELQSGSGNIRLEGNLDIKNKYGNLNAILNQLRLDEILGIADLSGFTGTLTATTEWKNLKEITGKSEFRVDSILYKNVTTGNINVGISVNKNQCLFNIMAADSSLICGLDGLIEWGEKSLHGNLSGNFNINEGRLKLVPFPLQTKGELTASIDKSENILESSLDVKNLFVTKVIETTFIEKTSLNLSIADSLVKTKLMTDFITAEFQSRSSLAELVKAIKTGLSSKITGRDSSEIINLGIISIVPDMNLDMTVQYDSLFGMFIPDTVLNFSDIKLHLDRKSKDSLIMAEILSDRLKFKSINGRGILMRINGEPGRLSCDIKLDSMRTGGILTGASGIGLDILQKSITGQVLIKDPKGIPLYQLSAEVLKRKDYIIFKTSVPQWILNSNKWTIPAGEILTIEKSTGDMVADVHLQHEQMKLDLYGRKSEDLHLDIRNVLLSMFVPPELILKKPDAIISADVTYSEKGNKNLDFKFDISQIKWSDIAIRKLVVTGNLTADSTGIKETMFSALLNDTASLTLDYGLKSSTQGRLLHSTFIDIPVKIAEPLISKYANELHGLTSGEITLTKVRDKYRFGW